MAKSRNTGEITEEQLYLFHEGTNYKSYQMLGAHRMEQNGQKGVRFSVWAPNANWVSTVGDFNGWNSEANPMQRIGDSGVWELFIPGVETNQLYKYAIGSASGEVLYKCDPYAFYCELRPKTASIVYDLEGYTWSDAEWMESRKEKLPVDQPILIYEVHLGSWKQREDGSFLTYRELTSELVDYVVDMGYTHIELMPVMEHPFDGSWGYQVTGFYAVTSRYGTPKDFMFFVDYCHKKGLSVILDWVPGHFPKDAHGLAQFDGTSIYEHPDPRRGEHPQWGTLIFDYGRHEVQSFLISNAIFWLEYYHVDGFRVDAVTSILYLDFGREEWLPNKFGGNENLEAADFLKRLNEIVYAQFPTTMMVAEDSSQWPMVTAPTSSGGLGFLYKWNMGWMNDTLRYSSMDPIFRKWNHNLLTFSLSYAFSENYILPLSHDEAVHGKRSLLNKMPGEYHQKFAGLRSLLGYMIAHPGKKLTFMGGEFGQFIEWRYDAGLDWLLLDYEMHQKTLDYVKAINHFYRSQAALWEDDNGWSGFEWICPDDNNQSVVAFLRKSRTPEDYLLVVVNFTPVERMDYRIGVPKVKSYQEIFSSDNTSFGGNGYENLKLVKVEKLPCHGYEQSVTLSLPPLSIAFYKPVKQQKRSNKTK
ncbi:MAG: glgB [Herbinix sp.]|nr:glgB [Herbinix sp.]